MTQSALDVLFRPFSLKSLNLPNRIVMAPMTRNFSAEGIPGDDVVAYYRRRAEGGVGLILSEGTVVARPAARNEPGIPFFHGDAALAGWQAVINAVHAAGARMGPQLWHTGATRGNTGWKPAVPVESPSGINGPKDNHGKAMSDAAIADTIAAFARAAADAKRLGFDVAEIHGAHGYLIDQFFWQVTNQRKDKYGGATLAERTRFAVEILKAVRQAVGPDFPILLRLSQWKQQDYACKLARTPDEMAAWLQPLVDAGADILHCSQRRYWEAEFPEVDGENGLNFAGWAKKLTGVPTIAVGAVGLSGEFLAAFAGEASHAVGLTPLLERMARDEFDLIAVGRALLADAQWPQKVREGRLDELRGFDRSLLGTLI